MGPDEGPNLYVYVNNRPVTSTDPYGLYTIDKSCKNKCQLMGGGGPNNPNQPPTLENLELVIRQQADAACANLAIITDLKLRSCIQKSCQQGKIKCKDKCPADAGARAREKFLFIPSRTANLCLNNWPDYTPLSYVGESVIHEWAHGCGWDHGQGKGVSHNGG
jgi:hypothetical protein